MAKTIDNAGRRLSRTLTRATVVPAAGLLIFSLVLIALIGYLLNTVYWVNHTNRVITQGRTVEKLLLDVQTATRGYYLTAQPSFLEPFDESYGAIRPALKELAAMVNDSPSQRARAAKLTSDSEAWLSLTMFTLAQVETDGGRPPPFETVIREKELFDDLRTDAAQLIDEEYSFRDQRVGTAFRSALWVTGIAIGVAAILGIVQTLITRGHLREVAETYRETLELSEHRNRLVRDALRGIDKELKAVADIQRSLLPIELPKIPTLRLAASYQTSTRVGGDYYDFFPLPRREGDDETRPLRWGVLIADVSGHGTPAAVLMAVTHSIAHGFEHPADHPSRLLEFVNDRLCRGYTIGNGTFVTAFYAIYDPLDGRLTYSSAGHNPPRLLRSGADELVPLDDAQGYPLGVDSTERYPDRSVMLRHGDTVVLYTDGIVEARNGADENFGVARLDAAVFKAARGSDPTSDIGTRTPDTDASDPAHIDRMMASTLAAVNNYAAGQDDDRTLLLVRVTDAADDDHRSHAVIETSSSLLEAVDV